MTQFVVPALAAGRRPYNYLTAMRLFRRPQLRRSVMPCRREALVSDPTTEFFLAPLLTDNSGDLHRLSPLIERS